VGLKVAVGLYARLSRQQSGHPAPGWEKLRICKSCFPQFRQKRLFGPSVFRRHELCAERPR